MYSNVFLRILPTGSALPLRVEVRRAEHLHHARERIAAFEQDGAEDGALGIEVVRRNARRNFERTRHCIAPRTTSMRHIPRDAAVRSNKFHRADLLTSHPPFRFRYGWISGA